MKNETKAGGVSVMNSYGDSYNSSQVNTGRLRLVITAQLLHVAANAHHVDELLQWLAEVIVRNLDVQVSQFWGLQNTRGGQIFVQLRAMGLQDISLPHHPVANNQVATTVGNILNERRSFMIQTVGSLFPSFQADLLERYGLKYCSCFLLNSSMLLPPIYNGSSAQEIPTPLTVAALLFLRHAPPQNVLSAINVVLYQMLPAAGKYGLLIPPDSASNGLSGSSTQPLQEELELTLSKLIPHRIEDPNLLTSSNPFAHTDVITDKQARRLYTAIDGHKNLEELCYTTGMGLEEVRRALKILSGHHRVELYAPRGHPVDDSLFLDRP